MVKTNYFAVTYLRKIIWSNNTLKIYFVKKNTTQVNPEIIKADFVSKCVYVWNS